MVKKTRSTNRLIELARVIVSETPDFFETKGPGPGNRATNKFMAALKDAAKQAFGTDHSEKSISGDNALAVDFYFPHERTIVEVALGLFRPKTEYERDILKAVMAKERGSHVDRLVFITKPGGKQKCSQPGRAAMRDWVEKAHGITIEIHELSEERG